MHAPSAPQRIVQLVAAANAAGWFVTEHNIAGTHTIRMVRPGGQTYEVELGSNREVRWVGVVVAGTRRQIPLARLERAVGVRQPKRRRA